MTPHCPPSALWGTTTPLSPPSASPTTATQVRTESGGGGGGPITALLSPHIVVLLAVMLALPPTLRLEGLPRSFAAVQLHFHWGRSGHTEGAEHLLDGHRAPAEMHVVHYDAERYANASEAQHHAAGLAVLGVLLEVGDEPNAAYANILSHLGSIRYAGQTTSIPSFNVQELLPKRLDRYYRYNGSLTTPPCLQSVIWTVFQQPVRISMAQLEQLQGSLYATAADEPSVEHLEDNFRDPQDLNQRPVLASFSSSQGYSTGEVIAIVFGTVLGCFGLFLAVHFVNKRLWQHPEDPGTGRRFQGLLPTRGFR
uniref:carbonic anhydrase n=1 Tax=Coturnix japonica TaxID=93934 RepID=A0A8C2YDL2_COTJA